MQQDCLHDTGGWVGASDVDDIAMVDMVLADVPLDTVWIIVERDGFGILVVPVLVIDVVGLAVSDVEIVGPGFSVDLVFIVVDILLTVVWAWEEGWAVASDEVPVLLVMLVLSVVEVEWIVVFGGFKVVDNFLIVVWACVEGWEVRSDDVSGGLDVSGCWVLSLLLLLVVETEWIVVFDGEVVDPGLFLLQMTKEVLAWLTICWLLFGIVMKDEQ